ncbi:arylesterase [Altererythrobacter aerius]|uniref:Arylesterase n=1 Tax=Tsuneonella aeria TaxID=1837929 RepID=A0A6I4TCX7_9SPHN|nr:arylesterase [Tsuneonella aeria]MXO74248.1 arylesterase [Tsuneonella aeria]
MRLRGWMMLGAAMALAGCQGEVAAPDPAPAATSTASAASAATDNPDTAIAGRAVRVLAFGDSLFAGYGLTSPDLAYPARLEAALRADGHDVKVTNAGVSGDTTAAGRQRLAFTLDSQPAPPDLVLLELGGNDLLRGLPPEQTRANLAAMLGELEKRGIPAVLMSLQAPPNYGATWQNQFDALYPALAKEHGATLVPFVTQAVFANPALLQADRVHPTAKGVEALVSATSDAVAEALPQPDGPDRL